MALNRTMRRGLLAWVAAVFLAGCSDSGASPPGSREPIAAGDIVRVACRLDPDDGADASPRALEIIAGSPERHFDLEGALLGMRAGERGRITVPPERAFGTVDPSLQITLPRVRELPQRLSIEFEEYRRRYGALPAPGEEAALLPYVRARAALATDRAVIFELAPEEGRRFEEPFGTTEAFADGAVIRIVLDPRVGAPFTYRGRPGRIAAAGRETFTVDLNHPLAGRPVAVDFEVGAVVKAGSVPERLAWIEDHEAGLAAARSGAKPVFLLLYAGWCGWSRKMMAESLEDPRVRLLKERFVWVRVDSEREPSLKARYGQEGFPLALVLAPGGEVLARLDGYQEAAALKRALEAGLSREKTEG
jgi:FKBP-type peptidyl-prolyl cis-trans isomerase 2